MENPGSRLIEKKHYLNDNVNNNLVGPMAKWPMPT